MTIEKLASKLQALRPAQVRRWREARALADPQLRAMLDQELAFEARRLLGSTDGRLLLSLPPPALSRGKFHVGTIQYERPKWGFGLNSSELLQGLAVFGRAGAGKTNAVFHLLLQLASKRVPFLFLDWKRTVRHLLPLMRTRPEFYTPGRSLSPLAFNPFMPPPGLEPRLYAHQLTDVLGAAYTLGEGARSLLQKVLMIFYERGNLAPSAKDVLDALHALPVTGRARQWHISAVRALEGLAYADLGSQSAKTQADWVASLLHGDTIIELDGLHIAARQFLVPTLFLWLYYVQLAVPKREQLQLVIVIEEAHHVLYRQEKRSRESIISTLLRQCREIGLAVVIVDQHAHLIASSALGNTFCTLCLNQKDPVDINKIGALCLLDEEEKPWLSRLPVGQAIVKMQDRWRDAFLVNIPHVAVKKGAVTDEVLRAYLNRKAAGAGKWESLATAQATLEMPGLDGDGPIGGAKFSPSPLLREALSEADLTFLQDVLDRPDDGVKARYRRLGWSMSRGTRVKDALLYAGWLESQWLPIGTSRILLLRLPSIARAQLGLGPNSASSGHESLVHEYWKRFYANKYAQKGYSVELEAPRPPPATGRVDVLARRDSETVAIEIETGSSDVESNIRQNKLAGFDRVEVVRAAAPSNQCEGSRSWSSSDAVARQVIIKPEQR